MKNKTLIETIIDEINAMNQDELVYLNNVYCDSINYMDNYVYNNDEEFFELINLSGLQVAQRIHFGDYNYSHEFVTFDGYGNFQSYSYFDKSMLVDLVPTMAEYIAENVDDFEHCFDINLEIFKDEYED